MADDLKKVKELLEIINNKVGKLETHVSVHSATMHVIKDQQSVMNEKLDNLQEGLDEVKETQERHTGALMDIESRLDGFAGPKKHLGIPVISE